MDAGVRDIGVPPKGLMRYAGPVLVAAVFAILATWTYGTWPDVLIDFGRELYLPWRIVEGDVLYRDLASLSGPLSPYVDAAWFAAAGASVHTLFLANLAVLAAFTALSYGVLCAVAGRFAATLATIVFLCTCAFGQQRLVGNYNFVAPYATDLTHGAMLGVAALAALWRGRSGGIAWRVVAGACVGLALLTKPECGLAAAAGLAAMFVCVVRSGREAVAVALGIALPPVIAVLLFAQALGLSPAIAAVATPWTTLIASRPMQFPFYRELLGIDEPARNAALMLAWTGAWWLALAPALMLGEHARPGPKPAWHRDGALLLAYAAALIFAIGRIPWDEAARPLPVVAVGALIVAARDAARSRNGASPGALSKAALTAGFATFSLVLLLKLGFRPRLSHYGFALAAPALMLAIATLAGPVPARIAARGGREAPVRIAVAMLFAALAAAFLMATAHYIGQKTVAVGGGRDTLRADERGVAVNEALEALAASPPGATVAVLPEGATLNFLARRRNPTPYVTFLPLEMSVFGEPAMLDALRRSPPDVIVLVHKSTAEYGVRWLGHDYGARLMEWVNANYEPERTIGDVPFRDDARFGIQLLRRRPTGAAPATIRGTSSS